MRRHRWTVALVAGGALAAAALAAGCAEGRATRRLAQIEVGMTREQVRARLGEPARVYVGDTCAGMGPMEGACALIHPAQRYEEWTWHEPRLALPDLNLYVYFGAKQPTDPAAWRVVYATWDEAGTVY